MVMLHNLEGVLRVVIILSAWLLSSRLTFCLVICRGKEPRPGFSVRVVVSHRETSLSEKFRG